MSSRLISNQSLLTSGSHVTAPFRVSRATPNAVLTVKIELSGTSSGSSTIQIQARHVANPGVTTGLVATAIKDTDAFPTIVVNETQAASVYQENFHFPSVGGVFDVIATVSGTDTFKLTLYIAP
jgi:hypothetical protein